MFKGENRFLLIEWFLAIHFLLENFNTQQVNL